MDKETKEKGTKKPVLLPIWQILRQYSDYDHPLKQADIIQYLRDDYGIELERKAVAKNIDKLRVIGIDVVSCREDSPRNEDGERREGYYLRSREFEDSELRLLIDSVLQSRHITAHHSKELIEKLCGLSNKYFRSQIKNVYSVNEWNKTENQSLFYNIDIVDEVIAEGKQVQYDYNKYGVDGKLHKSSTQIVTPYQLILHNQRYYLMGCSELFGNITFQRMDRISNMQPIKKPAFPISKVPGYENGIDYKRIASTMPYMYAEKPERIEFITDEWVIDQVVDWFGKDIKMVRIPDSDKKVRVELFANPHAMKYWALQYLDCVEVTKPASLRESIKESLVDATVKYQ